MGAVYSVIMTNAARCCGAIALMVMLLMPTAQAQTDSGGNGAPRNTVFEVGSGQSVIHASGVLEGIGVPAGASDINISAHGWQRFVDNLNTTNKYLVPFATANELQQFSNNISPSLFYFDFYRPADTVTVDFAAGVSDPANIVGGQTTTVDVATPAGRLDTRSDSAFNNARQLQFNTVTINMQRNDCRRPIDYNTGLERTDLPATICRQHNWQEIPNLVLTYQPVITHQGTNRIDPPRSAAATYARDFNSRINGRTWQISWGAPGGDPVPAVQYPPVGEACSPSAHNARTWLPLSSGNTQSVTGAAAAGAPNSCSNGVQGATRTWDVEQEAVCFDSQLYRQSTTRETNVTWSNVVCNPTTTDVFAFASTCQTPAARACISNGTNCLTGEVGTGSVLSFDPNSHRGSFCSSVSSSDSGQDGARVVFDLTSVLGGKTGNANIIIPYSPWVGVRDETTARQVMLNPMSYTSTPRFPADGQNGGLGEMQALTLYLPDVNANLQVALPVTQYDSGCGKNCRNNFGYTIDYNGTTKQLVIDMFKGARWKKHVCGSWNTATQHGRCNGKVWSEVRVVHPPAVCPTDYEYEFGPETWDCTDTCTNTVFQNTKIRYRDKNAGGCNVPGPWIDVTPLNYCPYSGTCDGSDDGGNNWWHGGDYGGGFDGGGGGFYMDAIK